MIHATESLKQSMEGIENVTLPEKPSWLERSMSFVDDFVQLEEVRKDFKETFERFANEALDTLNALKRQLDIQEKHLRVSVAQFEEVQASGQVPMESPVARVELLTSVRNHQWASLMFERANLVREFYTTVVEQLELIGPLETFQKKSTFWGSGASRGGDMFRPFVGEFVREVLAEVNGCVRARWSSSRMGEEETISEAVARFGSKRLVGPEKL